MSHTTRMTAVPLKSLSAIRAAIEALQQQGLKIKLTADLNPRMYQDYLRGGCDRGTQFKKDVKQTLGRSVQTADYCIEIENGKYDVGLVWDDKEQQYDVIFDSYQGHVGNVLGATGKGVTKNQMSGQQGDLGKFYQEYTKATTMEWAAEQGYQVDGCTQDEEGEYHLTVSTGY